MWKCTKCGEQIEDQFGACWKCGAAMEISQEPQQTKASQYKQLNVSQSRARKRVQSVKPSQDQVATQSTYTGKQRNLVLFPEEKVLFQSQIAGLILTTHRVRYATETMGYSQITSIMLEELASCALTRTSKPILLILAALSLFGGVVIPSNRTDNAANLFVGIILAAIFVVLYVATSQQILALASAGAAINTSTKGMNLEEVIDLIGSIEGAKNERFLLGKKSQLSQYTT